MPGGRLREGAGGDHADPDADEQRAERVATETSSVMRSMIDQNGNMVVLIFMIFALGYVILVVPVGLATTTLSKKLAVAR